MNRAETIRANRAAWIRGNALDMAVGVAGVVWAYKAIMGVAG